MEGQLEVSISRREAVRPDGVLAYRYALDWFDESITARRSPPRFDLGDAIDEAMRSESGEETP